MYFLQSLPTYQPVTCRHGPEEPSFQTHSCDYVKFRDNVPPKEADIGESNTGQNDEVSAPRPYKNMRPDQRKISNLYHSTPF